MEIVGIFSHGLDHAIEVDAVKAEDRAQYTLCVDLWCSLTLDLVGQAAASQLFSLIRASGLYSIISSADAFAKEKLASMDQGTEFTLDLVGSNAFWDRLVNTCELPGEFYHNTGWGSSWSADEADQTSESKIALACQVLLRFPKRFTICNPDITGAVESFKRVHNEVVYNSTHRTIIPEWGGVLAPLRSKPEICQTNLRCWPSEWLTSHMASAMALILNLDKPKVVREAVEVYENQIGAFSGGSIYLPDATTTRDEYAHKGQWFLSAECSKMLANKYNWLCSHGYFTRNAKLYGYYPPKSPDAPIEVCDRDKDVLVSAVPKDYETSRMIAPETPLLNIEGSRAYAVWHYLAQSSHYLVCMPPDDQSLNRDRALAGSTADDPDPWCTADLSHASDSIMRDHFFECLKDHEEIASIFRDALSDYMIVDGKRREVKMLATSGSVLTPPLQSTYFLAACMVAMELNGIKLTTANVYNRCSVYNDDIVVRKSIFPTVCEVLEALKLTVNMKKTFWGRCFRESCGGEYCFGVDVTGKYWPRKALSFRNRDTVETLERLVAMQHKLFEFPTCRAEIENIVLQLYPKMTYSSYGSENDDLWSAALTPVDDLRRSHCKFVTKWENPKAKPWVNPDTTVTEFYYYIQFLRIGPVYEDEFALLHGNSVHLDAWKHADKLPVPGIRVCKPLIREDW